MSNVIGFKAFKNTLKRDSGYAPVSGENGYSVIRCVFPVGDDWDDISEVSAGFFVHPKDIAVVTGTITRDREERFALFTIPGALLKQGERLHFGLFATVNDMTIATNTVVLDVARGIVSDDIDYDPAEAANMFEQFSNALNTALLGKANKATAGTAGELAALDGNGSPIRSGVFVEQSIGEGSNSRVPTTAAVKTALDGKADKAADGTDGELAALDGNGALIRSGFTVAESVGGGSDNMVPTTNAVRQHVFSMLDEALNGSDDGAPSLFVRQNTQTGKYQLVYEDSDDVLHVLFDFGLLPSGGTDNYNDLSNKPQIDGVTLDGDQTPAELGLQRTISTPDNYLQIYANGQLAFSSGLVIKNSSIISAERWSSGAMQVVNTQYDLSQYQQYLPQNCGFGLYIRMGGMPVSEYYFADSGKIYVQTAENQGSWIVSGWREISGGSQLVSGVVNQNGTITFTDSDGNTFTTTGSSVIGPQGAPGDDYVLTAQDKADIADIVLQELPTTQGVLYGNTSN